MLADREFTSAFGGPPPAVDEHRSNWSPTPERRRRMMPTVKDLVSAGYDAVHRRYADWVGYDVSRRRHYLGQAAEFGLLHAGDALDLGCGTGRHATAHLASLGFRVTGLDVSGRSIEVARREVPDGRFLIGDMATIAFPAESFDLVTAFYSIIHLPREDHGRLIRRVARWLRPGGGLVANLGTSGGDAWDDDWHGVPMYWSSWDQRTNTRLLEAAGLEVLVDTVETTVEDGRPVTFQWVIARKP
jgi:SAM-dependent methyltransferase